MTIFLFSALINLSIVLALLALVIVALVLVLWQVKKILYSISIDLIEIRSRWIQREIDLNNSRRLNELHHKRLGIELDQAQMGVRRERLELLASLDEVSQ